MKTVYTKEELQKALENKEDKIIVKGSLAEEIYNKKNRKKKIGIFGAILGTVCVLAIPFTGGTSALGAASVYGLTAGVTAGLTIGTITLTTTEILILCGSAIVLVAILKEAKVTFQRDDDGRITVIIEPQYKDIAKEADYEVN